MSRNLNLRQKRAEEVFGDYVILTEEDLETFSRDKVESKTRRREGCGCHHDNTQSLTVTLILKS